MLSRSLALLMLVAGASLFGPHAGAVTRFTVNCGAPDVGHSITVPGIHVLQRSVTTCGSNFAIFIQSSNVTLDLDGRALDGDTFGSAGIRVEAGRTNVVIRNGSVSRFEVGVLLNAPDVTVTGMTLHDHIAGVQSSVADGHEIRNSVISRNGVGLNLDEANTVTGNEITGHIGDGIAATDDNVITNNVISGNDGFGVNISADNKVAGNKIRANGTRGITAGNGNRITGNRIVGNLGEGVTVGSESVLLNNVVKGNLDGIVTSGSNRLEGNTANGNRNRGIAVGASNRLRDNRANGNGGDGIVVSTPDATTLIAGNVANDNGAFGINAQGNTAVRGKGKNTARRNGQAAQCDPTSLC